MILAIDVGNSRVKFGLFESPLATEGSVSPHLPSPLHTVSVPVGGSFPWADLSQWAGGHSPSAVIAGPNPAGIDRVRGEWGLLDCAVPRVVSDSAELGIEIRVDSPERVGIDRLLNAFAANVLRPREQMAIVVSSGTATTIDVVSVDGAFEGGAILPGFDLAARSLHEHTALLPLIDPSELSATKVPPLGKNTSSAIRSGLLYGQVGAVRELIARIAGGRDPFVIVTGGGGALLAHSLGDGTILEPELALRGLARLAVRGCCRS